MIVPSKNQKTYGVIHTENYFSFLGFCKKVNSDKIQKVDIFVDNILIDTIIADKHIEKIEDIYELEGFGFEYILPNEYIGQKSLISFKNHETKEDLQNSPYELIDETHPKFNEARFLNSLSQSALEEKIKDLYCPNSIGFLAVEENLEDMEFMNYIEELMIRFPNTIFNGFTFSINDYNLSFSRFPKINFIIPLNIENIFENIEIFIATSQNYTHYNTLIKKIAYYNDLTHRIYFDKSWYTSNKTIKDLDNGEDPYHLYLEKYAYLDNEIKEANGNKAKLFFNKILKNAQQPLYLLKENDRISDWYYIKRVDYVLKKDDVKKFLNKIFK